MKISSTFTLTKYVQCHYNVSYLYRKIILEIIHVSSSTPGGVLCWL